MRKLTFLLCALAFCGISSAPAFASPPLLVNCAPSLPCTTYSNPGNGAQGDPAWLAFGKVNANFAQLYDMFGTNSNLATNGTALYSDIVGLWTTSGGVTCSGTALLAANGTCQTGGTGGSSAFNAITSGTNTTAAMVVGSGASLNYAGTGVVNASEIDGVIQGVDTQAAGTSVTPDCVYSMNKVTATSYLIQPPVQSAPTTASTGGSLAGGTYYYVVTGLTSAGQTTASNEQSITSDTDAAPTNGALTSTSGGTLAAATYYVQSTWVTASGQTTGATQTSLAVAVDYVLNVAAPASPPSNATGGMFTFLQHPARKHSRTAHH